MRGITSFNPRNKNAKHLLKMGGKTKKTQARSSTSFTIANKWWKHRICQILKSEFLPLQHTTYSSQVNKFCIGPFYHSSLWTYYPLPKIDNLPISLMANLFIFPSKLKYSLLSKIIPDFLPGHLAAPSSVPLQQLLYLHLPETVLTRL